LNATSAGRSLINAHRHSRNRKNAIGGKIRLENDRQETVSFLASNERFHGTIGFTDFVHGAVA
jgi:hypothetical protein